MSRFPNVAAHYLPHVREMRCDLRHRPRVRTLLSDRHEATTLLGFLIEFAAVGVRLLRPAEETLHNAGRVCISAGFNSLGVELGRLAHEAAQRRLLLLDDLVQLADLWRTEVASGATELDLAALVRRPAPAAAQRHAALREHATIDALPFDSLAIELELGELARHLWPTFMRVCEDKIGSRVFEGMRYMQARTEHAALGRDELLGELDGLLRVVPELGPSMAEAGGAAIHAQLDVLELCLARGAALVEAPLMRPSSFVRA